jgi:hypothetical protein
MVESIIGVEALSSTANTSPRVKESIYAPQG